MLAETIDAGLLCTAAERKNDVNGYLCKSGGKTVIATELLLQLYKICHQRGKGSIRV